MDIEKIGNKGCKDEMNTKVQSALSLKLRQWIFVQWHICKSCHWEYAPALLRHILMMQFEAVEEEIEFSQIEKPS